MWRIVWSIFTTSLYNVNKIDFLMSSLCKEQIAKFNLYCSKPHVLGIAYSHSHKINCGSSEAWWMAILSVYFWISRTKSQCFSSVFDGIPSDKRKTLMKFIDIILNNFSWFQSSTSSLPKISLIPLAKSWQRSLTTWDKIIILDSDKTNSLI